MKFYEIILACAAVSAVWNVRSFSTIPYIRAFVITVAALEVYGIGYLSSLIGSNFAVINLYAFGCCTYYIFVYLHYFRSHKHYKFLRWLSGVWVVAAGIYLILHINYGGYLTLPYLIGLSIAVGCVVLYFDDVLKHRSDTNIFRDPYFYFSLGIVVFYVSGFPYLVFLDRLLDTKLQAPLLQLIGIGNIFLALGYVGGIYFQRSLSHES